MYSVSEPWSGEVWQYAGLKAEGNFLPCSYVVLERLHLTRNTHESGLQG